MRNDFLGNFSRKFVWKMKIFSSDMNKKVQWTCHCCCLPPSSSSSSSSSLQSSLIISFLLSSFVSEEKRGSWIKNKVSSMRHEGCWKEKKKVNKQKSRKLAFLLLICHFTKIFFVLLISFSLTLTSRRFFLFFLIFSLLLKIRPTDWLLKCDVCVHKKYFSFIFCCCFTFFLLVVDS